MSPSLFTHLDSASPPAALGDGARKLADWLRLRALPLWCTLGLQEPQGYVEAMSREGHPLDLPRRSLVQARQVYVYAQAARLGWSGPWKRAVWAGLDTLNRRFFAEDGTTRALIAQDDTVLDPAARLYDHAFVLLALASAKAAGHNDATLEARAVALRGHILASGLANGGFEEAGPHPYQANAQMHLLEAAMAWEAAGGDAAWSHMADRIVKLALTHFIDAERGCLREFYDADWNPALGEDGRLVEPGHQFEWAWLLTRHSLMRGRPEIIEVARRLYAIGRTGVSVHSGVALDQLNDDGSVRSDRARLWPQTEWLKAALILAQQSRNAERVALINDAETAIQAMWLYLTPDGLWRDKRLFDGSFLDEPAPASSFYHIMAAFDQLVETGREPGFKAIAELRLSLGQA